MELTAVKVNQQHGYILHTRPYAESSLLLDIFTADYGQHSLLAKGARRKKSYQRALLMPFRPLLLSWAGKGQLPILTAAEQVATVAELAGEALACGFYLNELVLKLLHRFDPHEGLYRIYHQSIAELGDAAIRLRVLRVFEKRLLSEIGFGLVLDHDVNSGEAIQATARYQYLPDKGPIKINPTADPPHHRLSVGGDTLQALAAGRFTDARVLREARQITQLAINQQLQPKKLRSREVMRGVNLYLKGVK